MKVRDCKLTDVTQSLNTGGVATSRHEFAVRSTVVINERAGTEPKLGTVFAARIHDREVVNTWFQDLFFLFFSQFGNASDQHFDFLVLIPLLIRDQLSTHMTFSRVTSTGSDFETRVWVEHSQVPEDVVTKQALLSHRLLLVSSGQPLQSIQ